MPSRDAVPGYAYSGPPGQKGARLHVLCIGISTYPKFGPPLAFTAISALRVFAWFLQAARSERFLLGSARLYLAPTDVEERVVASRRSELHAYLKGARGTGERAELDRVINAWVEEARGVEGDATLLYFAGHGIGSDVPSGDHFNTSLLASDFDDDLSRPPRAVRLQHVLDAMSSAGRDDPVPRSQVYLLDCCRERAWSGPPFEQGELRILAADRGRADPTTVDDRRLAVQFACRPGGFTMGRDNKDVATEYYSYYSEALVDALAAAAGDVTAELLFDETRQRLASAHPELQTQQVLHDDFVIVGPAGASAHPAAQPPPRAIRWSGRGRAGKPRRRGWWVGVAVAFGVMVSGAAGGAYVWLGRRPAVIDEVWFDPTEPFTRGSSPTEALSAFSECLAYAARLGPGGPGLPCDCPFESSAFARETWVFGDQHLARFAIDRFEVRNSEFVAWLDAAAADPGTDLLVTAPPAGVALVMKGSMVIAAVRTSETHAPISSRIRAEHGRFAVAPEDGDMPAVSVTWYGAAAFCRSRGRDLPTEAQWEYAARGPERRAFAWREPGPAACEQVAHGRAPGAECASWPAEPSKVGMSALDRTPEGVADLGGNVAEWVRDELIEPPGFVDTCADKPHAEGTHAARVRVIRGGAFADPLPRLRAAARSRAFEDDFSGLVGFRCAREAPAP